MPGTIQLDDDMVALFCDMIYRETGVSLDRSKKVLIEGRLRAEIVAMGLDSFAEYFRHIRDSSARSVQKSRFIDLVTTHETSFFRTGTLWEYLEAELERIVATGRREPMRIWSAACSTGEEPTTIAMLFMGVRQRHKQLVSEIHASDISPGSVEKAKSGRFGPNSVRDMGRYRALFDTMVVHQDGDYMVDPSVLRSIRFRTHNLFDPPFLGDMDITFLRNVLMYFTQADQLKVLHNIVEATRPEGLVIVGETESLKGVMDELVYVRPGVYQVKRNSHGRRC